MLVGISSLSYIILTYLPSYHVHMHEWYNSADKGICTVIMGLYLVKVYVSQHRQNEILSAESMMNIVVFAPVLLIPLDEMSMLNRFYIFLSISRYARAVYFCVIMIKFHELGEGDVDRQIKIIVMTLILIVIVASGVFVEIENA